MKKLLLSHILLLPCLLVLAQQDSSKHSKPSPHAYMVDSARQKDISDALHDLLKPNDHDEKQEAAKKLSFSVIPSVGYSLSTGFAANINSNVEFYNGDKKNTNVSLMSASAFIDTKQQRSLTVIANVWTDHNDYDLVANFRWLKYPSTTYGLGSFTDNGKMDPIDYNYVKLYATLLRKVIPNYYIGVGYNLDYHTNFVEQGNLDGTVSDPAKYGKPYTSQSSGLNLNLLYDRRGNPVNPLKGGFANVIVRQNFTFLGSDANWQSLIIDLRKYIKLSDRNNNVLAFWSYSWFTYNGNVPYLDLPGTGWDINSTSGRGYIIGRYTGKDMLYAEAEYRFTLSRSGLFGGVLFTNAQSFAEYPDGGFKRIIPAAGTGLRVKVNKHTNTNVCIDYAIGVDGSKGFFVNLGEVF